MPTPTKGPRLGGGPAHERLILANLATALFEHGRITTTQAKAKRLKPLAEHLITKAKRGDLHARRRVLRTIRDKGVVHTLFEEIGPRYENRPGGYTRVVKIGPRKGDNAAMAVIELVEPLTVAQTAVGEAEGATRRSARDRAAVAPVPAPEQASAEPTPDDTDTDTDTAPAQAAAEEPVAAAEPVEGAEVEPADPAAPESGPEESRS